MNRCGGHSTTDSVKASTHGLSRPALRLRRRSGGWMPIAPLLAIPCGLHRTRVSEMRHPGVPAGSASSLVTPVRTLPAPDTFRRNAFRRRSTTTTI